MGEKRGADQWWVIYNTWRRLESNAIIPTLRKIPPIQRLADIIGERPVSRWALPFQQTLAIKQAFLERATAVFAQCSIPNLCEIRHSSLNSAIGSHDTDPFHGGGRIHGRVAIRPAHLSTSKWKNVETNMVPQRRHPWKTSMMRCANPNISMELIFRHNHVVGARNISPIDL